jgi:hypothetical protein
MPGIQGEFFFTSPSTGFSGFKIFGVPGKEIECKKISWNSKRK